MSPHRYALLTIRNLTPLKAGRMFDHERDYSEENSFPGCSQRSIHEKNSDQRESEEDFDYQSVVPRTSARLLRDREQVGVYV